MDQYYLFGFLPLLKPLSAIPFAPSSFLYLEVHVIIIDLLTGLVTWSLVHCFDTLTLVPVSKL